MKKYIVALDQGTTSSRAVVVDASGAVVAAHGIEFPQIYPKAGSSTIRSRFSLRRSRPCARP